MKKSLLLSILAIWSAQVFAAGVTTVRLNTDIDLVVTGTTNTTFEIGSVEPSGDGSSDAAPAKIYIPMDGPNSGVTDEVNYFTGKGVTSLFTAASASTINFPLYLNSTASDYYLYIAIKDVSNNYKIAAIYGSPFNSVTNVNQTFSVSTAAMCTQTTDCTNFALATGTEKTYLAYFFLTTTLPAGLPIGTTVTPSSYAGGMYFEINMSNRIYTSSQVIPSITEIRPGDRRVIIKYSSTASILKPKAIRVYNHGGTAAAVTANQPIQSYYSSGGDLNAEEFTYVDSGEVTLTGLANDVSAYYSVLAVDVYKFGTVLSDDLVGSPKTIEELLKANQCFLLTAGFGEEHFVISYFRHFRDTVLAKSFLGREFIHFYYELAPKYALLMYKNETLRAMVRGVGYTLYFIFNYYLLILAGALISGSGIYLYKKREKIKI